MPSRRRFIAASAAFGAGVALPPSIASAAALAEEDHAGLEGLATPSPALPDTPLTAEDLEAAARVQGLTFTEEQRALMLPDVHERLAEFEALRAADVPNSLPPALALDLTLGGEPRPAPGEGFAFTPAPRPRPGSEESLAFATVADLGGMLRAGSVTSVELARFFLARLERIGTRLHAVVNLTASRALDEAARADAELGAGRDRGPLHGIPYGAKDLLAARGAPTTWGVSVLRDQTFEDDALAVERLAEAGAVLVAKLSLGELAWGDVWFGGTTRSPWNEALGASGSSAGPGAAVAAGLVPFAIGSETYGSIVSPSTRNGVTGLRPTFGRVPTRGAMALSWSMDKLGPMTRSALDAALVFEALRGPDPLDASALPDPAFPFRPDEGARGLRVGVLQSAFDALPAGPGAEADRATLDVLRGLGADLRPVELPGEVPVEALLMLLSVEGAAAFDAFARSGGLDTLVRQERYAWPNVFRHARLVPAVEYLTANRLRTRLMQQMGALMRELDVLVTPTFGSAALAITNLTGHPAVVIPNGFFPVQAEGDPARRTPRSVLFVGPLWQDHLPLRLAHAVQAATGFHAQRPPVR